MYGTPTALSNIFSGDPFTLTVLYQDPNVVPPTPLSVSSTTTTVACTIRDPDGNVVDHLTITYLDQTVPANLGYWIGENTTNTATWPVGVPLYLDFKYTSAAGVPGHSSPMSVQVDPVIT